MKCNEATQGYCANADQDGNCYNVDCEAYREDTVKHTDGPWKHEKSTKTIRSAKKNYWIATMNSWDGAVDNDANARLIAAAPDLLEALKIVLVQYGEYQDGQGAAKFHAVNIARDAIAKAEGKEA